MVALAVSQAIAIVALLSFVEGYNTQIPRFLSQLQQIEVL